MTTPVLTLNGSLLLFGGSPAILQDPAASGGTISISVDRTGAQVAPDSVRFTADLSASTFDTPSAHAASSNLYNPQYHDLIYLWDFGDSGNWTAPENVLTEWKAKTYARGPWVAHCYTTSGDKTVTLYVYELSSGKFSSTSTVINIKDPNDEYPTTQTICIYPNGESVGTVPTGAQTYELASGNVLNTSSAAWTDNLGGSKKRFLFKAGGTYDVALSLIQTTTKGVYFGSYEIGARPIFGGGVGGSTFLTVNQEYDDAGIADFRVSGINFHGGWVPGTTSPTGRSTAISLLAACNAVISDCNMDGLIGNALGYNAINALHHIHTDNVSITNNDGEYTVLCGSDDDPNSTIAFTGVKIARSPYTYTEVAGSHGSVKASIRISKIKTLHMRGCDIFATQREQPAMKLNAGEIEGGYAYIHSSSFEGVGLAVINVHGNTNDPETLQANNYILDGNVMVAGWGTRYIINNQSAGLTVRDNLFIQPDVLVTIQLRDFIISYPDPADTQVPESAPIKTYNNTAVIMRTYLGNNSVVPSLTDFGAGATYDNYEANNVLFATEPAMVAQDGTLDDDDPLDETTILWLPRNLGKGTGGGAIDTAYLTPTDSVAKFSPNAESAALDSAVTTDKTLVSYLPIDGQTNADARPTPANRGAWE